MFERLLLATKMMWWLKSGFVKRSSNAYVKSEPTLMMMRVLTLGPSSDSRL